MAFSPEIVEEAWEGKCERCGKQLVWDNRGRENRGCWEAHHRNTSKGDILSNCEILCFECHTQTESFGKPRN